MAEAKRAGGLYRGVGGSFHDAEGQGVSLTQVLEVDADLLTKAELKAAKKAAKAAAQAEGEKDA